MRKRAMAVMLAFALPACSAGGASDELAERVQQLEDEKDIREIVVKYGEYLDARDYAGYASLFASDGTWTGGFGSATGPEAIEAMLTENLGAPEEGFINKDNFHLNTTIVVDVDGDTATARSRYMFFTKSEDDSPYPLLAGRYFDDYVRENGEWKIMGRTSHGVIPYRDGNNPNRPPRPEGLDSVVKD